MTFKTTLTLALLISSLVSSSLFADSFNRRCTCERGAQDTVASCKAFSDPSCDVVYVDAYTNGGCKWNTRAPLYWKNAIDAATQNHKILGAMVNYSNGAPNWSAVNACFKEDENTIKQYAPAFSGFKLAFIDVEQVPTGGCGSSPVGSFSGTLNSASLNSHIQVAVGNQTCEAAWGIAQNHKTLMCYDGGEKKCKTEMGARYMYKNSAPGSINTDINYP